MFGESSIVTEKQRKGAKEYTMEDIQAGTKKSQKKIDLDAGAYNLAFVKVKKGVKVEDAIKSIEKEMKDNGCKVKVIPWKSGISYRGMTTIIRGALILFTLLIFFVAIIIIMNTLTMAAIERSAEIAMMRAIGARKGFISEMFFAETGMLSFVFGGAGI